MPWAARMAITGISSLWLDPPATFTQQPDAATSFRRPRHMAQFQAMEHRITLTWCGLLRSPVITVYKLRLSAGCSQVLSF